MAIYTNLEAVKLGQHGMFESSRLKSSIVGNIYDVVVRDENDKAISVDNGVAVKLGNHVEGELQERYATIAKAGDKVVIIGNPAIVKDAFTKAQSEAYNYSVPAGVAAKAYEVLDDDDDMFAVASYQITKTTGDVAVGDFVVVDGNGAYKVVTADPSATNGFVAKVHSLAVGTYYTMVRLEVLQNKTIG